ncbi:MAG TPA: hypothetical protein VIG30_14200 [Ktedonobacterales bacterium]
MNTLVLKLVLTPALIGMASLAGRRWGPAVSGWLIGLPFTSGPILFFLALNRGTGFAAAAAAGTLTGTLSQVAFCLSYAWVATWRHSWPVALALALLAFGAMTTALRFVALGGYRASTGRPPDAATTLLLLAVVMAALAVGLRVMPGTTPLPRGAGGPEKTLPTGADREVRLLPGVGGAGVKSVPPRWDLPARMVLATVFVLALTASAPALGAQLTGLLAPFPLYASILTVFAHQQQGPVAAAGVLRGLLLGLFSFAGFCVVLAILLAPAGIATAFGAAIALALGIQGGSLRGLRRGERSQERELRR